MLDAMDTREILELQGDFEDHYETMQQIESLFDNDFHEVYAARHRHTGILCCVKKYHKEKLT